MRVLRPEYRGRPTPWHRGGGRGTCRIQKGGRADEASERSEEERTTAPGGAERSEGEGEVGGIGEVQRPPGEGCTAEEGEGGAINELRNAMEGMDVEGNEIDKG